MFRQEAAELGALRNDHNGDIHGSNGDSKGSNGDSNGSTPKHGDGSLNGKDTGSNQTRGNGSTNGKDARQGQADASQPQAGDHEERPRHILFLGSSLGNFDRSETAPFLSALPLRPGSQDTLLIGLDGRPSAVKQVQASGTRTPLGSVTDITRPGTPDYFQGQKKVEIAYDDPKGKTRDFIMHGLEVVNQELKNGGVQEGDSSILDLGAWEYKSRYNIRLGELFFATQMIGLLTLLGSRST
jgi:hypothetical protein